MKAEQEKDEKTGLPVLRQHQNPDDKFKDIVTISGQRLMSFKDMRRTGTITLRQLHNKKTTVGIVANDQQIDVPYAYDNRTGILYGIPMGIYKDDSGNVLGFKFKMIRLKNRTYVLENYADAEEWHVIKNWPQIVGGTIVSPGMEAFEVIDNDAHAKKSLQKKALRRQAEDFIESLEDETALKDFARLFKIDVYNNSIDNIRNELMELAGTFNRDHLNNREVNPVLEKMEKESETAIQIILRRCVANGVVEESLERGFTYRNIPLGISEINAVEYLRSNKNVLTEIDSESKRKEKERNKNKAAGTASPAAKEATGAGAGTEVDDELEALRAEAKLLSIKGAHFATDKEKLKAKIAEAKAAKAESTGAAAQA